MESVSTIRVSLSEPLNYPSGNKPVRLSSYVMRFSSALIYRTFSTWDLDRRPCFVRAAMERCAVRGPVERPRPIMAGFWHAPPACRCKPLPTVPLSVCSPCGCQPSPTRCTYAVAGPAQRPSTRPVVAHGYVLTMAFCLFEFPIFSDPQMVGVLNP